MGGLRAAELQVLPPPGPIGASNTAGKLSPYWLQKRKTHSWAPQKKRGRDRIEEEMESKEGEEPLRPSN